MSNYHKLKNVNFDLRKFVQLVADYWKVSQAPLYFCKEHGTLFNILKEPCLGCYSSCRERNENDGKEEK